MPDLADDLALALRLADAADAQSRARFRAADLRIETKPDRTPVTDGDRAVERAIREILAAERPDDAILGEEYGGDRAPGRQWIVDPIDGTTNFLRGQPVWGSLIALAVDGEPVVGVASAPALGRRWWGARGQGAWAADLPAGEPTRLAVSGVRRLEDAFISYNAIQGWDDAGRLDALLALTRGSWRSRALGDFWAYVLVAEGQLDLAGEHDLKVYDIAALVPIVLEAGGRFTDLAGGEGPWQGTALATNGLLHDEVLAVLDSHPADPAR
ncbi:inositol monophosphatase family protein [Amnibacterium setariae]|uniref:Histidinol-phosphatase n=1 Tax=Amnibacterium setariae TaxID=2306585 RepID=A0A3A1U6B8_9MICO|nr:inositol monophosphatase family protein [Amnibacterium setariae]RIX30997.1 histidinol phosphatase [Amnibacterium setariae]